LTSKLQRCGRVIYISSSSQWLEVVKRMSSEPDFLKMTLSRFKFSQDKSKSWVQSFGTNGFSFEGIVFVEKKGECGIVSVNKFIEISRRVSDELRVDNITLRCEASVK